MLGTAATLMMALLLVGCSEPARYPDGRPRQAQTLALDAAGRVLAVVNPDADSLSILDVEARQLLREIPLGPRPTQGSTESGAHYEPLHAPRGVDLSPDGRLAYVACQGSGRLLTVDVEAGRVVQELPLGAEPVTALVHPGGGALYVALYQSGEVVRLPLTNGLPDESSAIRRRTTDRPFGLALDAAGRQLYVTRFLLSPGLDVLDAETLDVQAQSAIDEVAPRGHKLLAHGVPRGLYGAAVRPGVGEVWVPHLLLAVDVAQPELDFESTVFPALSLRGPAGEPLTGPWGGTLSTDSRLPKVDGAFADIVSGPRALAFTPDGSLALVVDMSSEDVLVVDAERRVQAQLIRPLPGDLPEGIVVSPDGRLAFVDERASGDVAVLRIADPGSGGERVRLEPAVIPRLAGPDPMPPELRLGQRLFYSANSAEFPMTKNFWVACASCHLEGRSDAVTWRFESGPRDTPSNAGGTQGTGFLMRNATRNLLAQYDETARIEQGGDLDLNRPADRRLLDALSAYVDRAIPLPKSPEIDVRTGQPSAAAQRGQEVWTALSCGSCHGGPRFTDSGANNPGLDLGAEVVLHDVGTCAGAPFPDRAPTARNGAPRPACSFDTPGLRGAFDTAPYLHDGRAATLGDVIDHFVTFLKLPPPTPQQRADLVAYLRSL